MAVVSEQYNFLFLLSPGTGSTATARALVDSGIGEYCPEGDVRMGPGEDGLVDGKHTTYRDFERWNLLPRPLDEYQVVTTTRNPFDFWVTAYIRKRDRWSKQLDNPDSHLFKKQSDIDGVRLATQLSFSEWMQQHWAAFPDDHAEMLHSEFGHHADYFLRFEAMDETFAEWMKERGVESPPALARENVTERDSDYRQYYDEATRQLLERVYRFYLKRFNYAFD